MVVLGEKYDFEFVFYWSLYDVFDLYFDFDVCGEV